MSINRGHFVVVEGLEGAGKSTAMTTIRRFLRHHVESLITTREPGGTNVGEAIRPILKSTESKEALDPRAELLLFYASRVQLVQHVIMPALNKGIWVLADRFELSTFAYQGGGRKLDYNFIKSLSDFSLKGFQPDLTIFLDISPEEGLQRAYNRGKIDRIEQEPIEFFTDVYNAYHKELKEKQNVIIIDASLPLMVVQRKIKNALREYLQRYHANT